MGFMTQGKGVVGLKWDRRSHRAHGLGVSTQGFAKRKKKAAVHK
jgi:hypothetical protein